MPARILRLLLAVLALALLPSLFTVSRAAADALTPEQKSAIDHAIHDYLINNPDVVIQALEGARLRSEQRALERQRKTLVEKRSLLLQDPDSPVGGNTKGDVTIVEFFDYRCPYCKQVEPSLEALLKEDKKLRIVYKEYPVLGPNSTYAARVALAARPQGKYEEFHRAMMGYKAEFSEEAILRVATSVGIDLAKLRTELQNPAIEALIKRNHALADDLDIDGTPAFVVGSALAPGAVDLDGLRKLVAMARGAGG